VTIAELGQASGAALGKGREGNKNNPAFARKSYEADQLIGRLQSGPQVDQKQIDGTLQSVWLWLGVRAWSRLELT